MAEHVLHKTNIKLMAPAVGFLTGWTAFFRNLFARIALLGFFSVVRASVHHENHHQAEKNTLEKQLFMF